MWSKSDTINENHSTTQLYDKYSYRMLPGLKEVHTNDSRDPENAFLRR